jgi:hypothetical protein
MNDIVSFPGTAEAEERRRIREQRRRDEAEAAEFESARLEEKRQRLERARVACAARKRMKTPSERYIVARNLWDILERLERGPHKIPKAKVLVESGKATVGESTKHLDRYALKPGLTEAQAEKKSSKLIQTIRVYIDIARKSAALEGSPEDDAVLCVLQGSKYLSELPDNQDDEPDSRAASRIAESLRRMTERIVSRNNLSRYFEKCRKHRIVPDKGESGETIIFSGEYGSEPEILAPKKLSSSDRISIKRCPGVFIGSVATGPVKIVKARATFFEPPSSRESTLDFSARMIETSDVYLYLTPSGTSASIVPALCIHDVVRLKPNSELHLSYDQKNSDVGPDTDFSTDPDDATEDTPPISIKSYCTLGERHGKISEDFSFFPDRRFTPDPILINDAYVAERFRSDLGKYFESSDRCNSLSVELHLVRTSSKFDDHRAAPRIEIATYDQLLRHLGKPLFLRYHDNLAMSCPIQWTDERREATFFYVPSEGGGEISEITTATEGTLLARLERWVRGSLTFHSSATHIYNSNIEDELDKQAAALLTALDKAIADAEQKIKLSLASRKEAAEE